MNNDRPSPESLDVEPAAALAALSPAVQLTLDAERVLEARRAWSYTSARPLTEVSSKLSGTEGATLLAGLAALLARYTQQTDVAIDLIELRTGETSLLTSIVLSPSGEQTFASLTERAQASIQQGRAAPGSVSSNVALVFAREAMSGSTLDLTLVSSRHDLHFIVHEEGDRTSLVVGYDSALFRETTIERWALSFGILLAAALHDAELRVDALPLLSSSEVTALELVCVGRASDEQDEPVLLRFERFARELPNAVAARHRTQTLSY
ncbi:MAG: hypothetical protein RLZZ450_6054, partial [Pseudomonadota bacterium]